MPKSLGGTAQLRASGASSLIGITSITSYSDASIPLISVFSPAGRLWISRREIVSRLGDKDWYIQRYDLGDGHWQRVLVIVRKRQEEWTGEDGSAQQVGLSVVFFDLANRDWGESRAVEEKFWERKAYSVEQEQVLIRELKAELNWQHSASQFED
ncbi:hypothetical protein GGR51DRAFT_559070 [Nemania sp. FL0031]|nr:hypothetical protein GGR51DRAFT_559070 [Nemania sp. FL0031]